MCIAVTSCDLHMSSNPKSFGVLNKPTGLHSFTRDPVVYFACEAQQALRTPAVSSLENGISLVQEHHLFQPQTECPHGPSAQNKLSKWMTGSMCEMAWMHYNRLFQFRLYSLTGTQHFHSQKHFVLLSAKLWKENFWWGYRLNSLL